MKTHISLWVSILLFSFAGAQVNPQFSPVPASFNINSANPIYALDIEYDSADPSRQAFHLFLPDTTGTFPLVIFHHGGGFTGGSRSTVLVDPPRMADIKFFLEEGIAYASMGYRLITTNQLDTVGVIKCLNDSKRGLQFIRYNASDLHIDPETIALAGTSAGAGTSLWLATRTDMADPSATDPILRQSTRVCAVNMGASQATYDLYKWESMVFDNFDGQGTNFTVDSMVNVLGFPLFSSFYGGLDSNYQLLYDPALIQYRQDVDMLFHMSSDDPPIYFKNGSGAVHPSQDLYHHSLHGQTILDAALLANLPEVRAEIPARGINTTQGESGNDFLLRHLNSCALSTGIAEAETKNTLTVYPNPARFEFSIQLNGGAGLDQVQLFSMAGKRVLEQRGMNSNAVTISVDSFPAGIYLLQAKDMAGTVWHKKIVIE